MTSIRDLFSEPLAIGERFDLSLERDAEGRLVADHPNESSPADIAVVEVVGRFEGGRLVGRAVQR